MTAKITRLDCDGESRLFVPGTDAAQILAAAQAELDDDEQVFTPLEDIKVDWWRVNPCHENSCWDGGGHNGHWAPTKHQTRGGFQGGTIEIGYQP